MNVFPKDMIMEFCRSMIKPQSKTLQLRRRGRRTRTPKGTSEWRIVDKKVVAYVNSENTSVRMGGNRSTVPWTSVVKDSADPNIDRRLDHKGEDNGEHQSTE